MIFLIGANGHAKVVAEIIEENELTVGGLLEIDQSIVKLHEYDVYQDFPSFFDEGEHEIIITIGDNARRKKVSSFYPYKVAKLVHPGAIISSRAEIGEGTVIMGGVTVNSDVKIGKHVIINTNSSVDHDCTLEDYVHVSPNVALAGNVSVGEGTHIGVGACVIPNISIGKWCTIGAGAVIIEDIDDGVTVVGNPGRAIKVSAGK